MTDRARAAPLNDHGDIILTPGLVVVYLHVETRPWWRLGLRRHRTATFYRDDITFSEARRCMAKQYEQAGGDQGNIDLCLVTLIDGDVHVERYCRPGSRWEMVEQL